MRTSLTFTFLLFILIQIQAQNAYFRPFGSTIEEVTSFLETKKFLKIETTSEDEILVIGNHFNVDYHFKEGYLLNTKMTREFVDKHDASKMVESFRNYFTIREATMYDKTPVEKSSGTFYAEIEKEKHTISHVFGKSSSTVSLESENFEAYALAKVAAENPTEVEDAEESLTATSVEAKTNEDTDSADAGKTVEDGTVDSTEDSTNESSRVFADGGTQDK